ncbi:MAG: hypothetical protein JWL72_1699 [Ilumatobacteraceae bacterium]|nr:hypothetical protein [Ilumatobacteraceae bacterium]
MSAPVENQPSKLRAAFPWLREVAVIGAIYLVYTLVRNQFGSANLQIGDEPRHAFHNAVDIINLEKAIGLFHEQTVQRWFLGTPFIKFFNIFYGTAHFAVTLGILIWLFVTRRESFGRWRTTLMATTILALIGFMLFPLMPPRLFNAFARDCGPGKEHTICYRYGGGDLAVQQHEPDYKFVDTLREVGGLWNFDSKKLDSVSNQYAAMPSLHIGWSTWCTLVLLRFAKRRRTKILAVLYPIVTLTAIVATANHYIIDAVGGLVIVGAGYLIGLGLERLTTHRDTPEPTSAVDDAALVG